MVGHSIKTAAGVELILMSFVRFLCVAIAAGLFVSSAAAESPAAISMFPPLAVSPDPTFKSMDRPGIAHAFGQFR